jgi:uncharacterized protein (TIGR03067 family)
MRHVCLALFLLGGMAAAADDKESKSLLKDLEGDYKVTAAEKAGEKPPPGFLDELEKVSIKGNRLTISFKSKGTGKSEEKSATITLDASKKPAQIDMRPEDGPKRDELVLGIVAVDGDTVKMCWGDSPKATRPTDFSSSKENKNFLLTLKRMK